MNNLFKTGTYSGNRYSGLLTPMDILLCKNNCQASFPTHGRTEQRIACKSACDEMWQAQADNGGGNGGGGNGGGGNGGGGNGGGGNGGGGNGGGANSNGKGPDTKTIMIWTGVALLLIALIIGGAIAIKK